jgi:hypothetical protein
MPRTPREEPRRVILVMPDPLLEAIDEFHHTRRLPSQAAAIRRLIEIGVAHRDDDPPVTTRR